MLRQTPASYRKGLQIKAIWIFYKVKEIKAMFHLAKLAGLLWFKLGFKFYFFVPMEFELLSLSGLGILMITDLLFALTKATVYSQNVIILIKFYTALTYKPMTFVLKSRRHPLRFLLFLLKIQYDTVLTANLKKKKKLLCLPTTKGRQTDSSLMSLSSVKSIILSSPSVLNMYLEAVSAPAWGRAEVISLLCVG